jgi:hypothetical protein
MTRRDAIICVCAWAIAMLITVATAWLMGYK